VRNKILIDVQGEDVLMQIFTSVVLQRAPGEEAPFLEFIQRVCACAADGEESCEPIRPGCGGFGIRNFLTLFLSIEVSKAIRLTLTLTLTLTHKPNPHPNPQPSP
jgi:4-hydroxyphenylpyruvate dioxygenase-like putative hemolysin